MRHLTNEELLDLAEGDATPAVVDRANTHLASCAQCADELDRARTALSMARDPLSADVPEPSPLFWEHFSARVSDAVAAEPTARAPRWFNGAWGWPVIVPAAAVVALIVAVALRVGPAQPASQTAANAQASSAITVANPGDATVDGGDSALALLADLAGDFEWDDAADAGLLAGSGAIDRAMSELTADERVELHRLLNEELKRWKTPGA
jgi:hypothetical protein